MNKKNVPEKGYRVVKAEAGQFWIDCGDSIIKCKARSKLKKESIIVGDFVSFDTTQGEPVIAHVFPRKNRLIRPSIANLDQIIVMVAAVPEADYLLLDKLVINAARQNIEIILCVNKSDLNLDNIDTLKSEYSLVVSKIIATSALNGDISSLEGLLEGKLSCMAGQSAVGKSTFINVLLGNQNQRTGELSRKILRGKNTTTASEIFAVCGGYVVDTPGFSIVDIFDIPPEEINLYYTEFDAYRSHCKFSTCKHTGEPLCAVRQAAENGNINRNRYERYQKIYSESKDYFDRNPKQRIKNS